MGDDLMAMASRLRIVFLGMNDAGRRIYDWLIDHGENVLCLITHKSQFELIKELKPDMIISCGFRYIVPKEILVIPPKGCINIHSGYLPYNRGANPNVWSIVEGTPAGVTIHYMDEGVDTGPIIAQREIEVSFSDTAKDLYSKLGDAEFELFKQIWSKIKTGNIEPAPQRRMEGTCHKLKDFRKLCKIHLDETCTMRELLNRLRALTFPPYHNAFVEVNDERFYLRLEIYPENLSSLQGR